MISSSARGRARGLILLCGMAFSSCGIDTISYLKEKPSSLSVSASAITMKGPSAADISDNYYGIDIFYRIYADEDDAISDYSNVISKQNSAESVPGSVTQSYVIASLDYRQPSLDGSSPPIPIILKDDLDDGYVSIEFLASREPSLTIIDSTGATVHSYALGRAAISGNEYLSFLDKPESGDSDFRSRSTDTDSEYYVQFFACAYGLDYTTFNDLYGDSVFLGRIALNY